jgi:ACS family tartrate transporter-like MFS transporter
VVQKDILSPAIDLTDLGATPTTSEHRTLTKVYWRVVPIIFLGFFIAFLDRTNIGMAALQMNSAIGLSPTIFAAGAGIFFLGYVFLEVPSNLILDRVGARVWIARIMITWGLISAATALVSGPISFYAIRFLLGAAEAGFFPGVVLYLTYWFPAAHRARAASLFLIAVPASAMLGAPVSGLILSLDGYAGIEGWRWMFILEGLPAVLLGFVVLWKLTDRPEKAAWLNAEESMLLRRRLAAEQAVRHRYSVGQTLTNRGVLLLSLVNLLWVSGFYGMAIWLPQIVKSLGFTNLQVGAISAVPPALAIVGMTLWSRRSDHTGDRVWHVAISGFLAGIGAIVSALTGSPVVELIAITVGMVGAYCFLPVFWALPQELLGGTAAAAGIALISAIGNVGGFVGPYLVGWLNKLFGNFEYSLIALGTLFFLSSVAVLLIRHDPALRPREA